MRKATREAWFFLAGLIFVALAVAFTTRAWATDPPTTYNKAQNPHRTDIRTFQDQGQQQFSENLSNSSVGDISPTVNNYALMGPVTQIQVAECFKPAKGKGRSWSVLWGLVSVSGYAELDPECVAMKISLLERQLELERSKLSREVSECRRERVVAGICK